MNYVTGTEVIEVLQELGEIEWAKCNILDKIEENFYYPPLIVWRFKVRDRKVESWIVEAVESFKGNVDWEIKSPGKNWVICPKKVSEFQVKHHYRIYVQALSAFSGEYPSFCQKANEDLPALAQHMKRMVSLPERKSKGRVERQKKRSSISFQVFKLIKYESTTCSIQKIKNESIDNPVYHRIYSKKRRTVF